MTQEPHLLRWQKKALEHIHQDMFIQAFRQSGKTTLVKEIINRLEDTRSVFCLPNITMNRHRLVSLNQLKGLRKPATLILDDAVLSNPHSFFSSLKSLGEPMQIIVIGSYTDSITQYFVDHPISNTMYTDVVNTSNYEYIKDFIRLSKQFLGPEERKREFGPYANPWGKNKENLVLLKQG